MAINKKLIHFEKGEEFDKRLKNNEIFDTSIVFIKDRQQIYTHGQFYNCDDLSEEVVNIVEDINSINAWKNNISIYPLNISHKITQLEDRVAFQSRYLNTVTHTTDWTSYSDGISAATSEQAGVMSATDKAKLDNLYTNELIDSKLFLENGNGRNSIQLKNRDNITPANGSVNLGLSCTINEDSMLSYCEGYGNLIINSSHSHAEGAENIMDTKGQGYTHIEGSSNKAYGYCNHAEGEFNITYNLCEHAQGYNNLSTENPDTKFGNSEATLHSVGNGSSGNSKKHNAHEIKQDGTHYIPDIYATNEDGILYEYYEKPMINLLETLHNLQEACSPTKISDTTALMVMHITDGMYPMDTLMADDDPDKYMYQEIYTGLKGYMGMLVLDPNFLVLIFTSNYVLPGHKGHDEQFSRVMTYAKVDNIITSSDENSDPVFYLFTTIGFDKVCVKLGRDSGDIYKI